MGRRTRGEGSIYKRKDGRWCGKYTDCNGKTRYVYAKTKSEVRTKLTKVIAEKDAGVVYDTGTLTVGEYLDRWLDSVKDTVKDRTWMRYEEVTRLHLKPNVGKVRLSRLNALQLQSLYRDKLDTGFSPRTVQIIHTTINKALKQAARWSLIPRNVCEGTTPPRPTKKEIRPLDKGQMKALLNAAKNDKLYAFYVLACTTGIRNGEALALRWDKVDLQARTLQVTQTIFNGIVSTPKTNSGRRTIRLSKLAVHALKQHRIKQGKQCISEWVFSTSKGTPISVHNIYNRSWKPLLKRAGLPPNTRMHDLRHSAATLMLANGTPVKVVSEMLGHADISTTLSVYAHVLPDMQSMAADGMDDALG